MKTLRLRDLFDQVVDLPPADRPAFLDRLGVDATLRAQLEQLLESDTQEGAPLSGSVQTLAAGIGLPPVPQWQRGTQVGPFTLVEPLGQGGFATVFHAVRDNAGVRQDVALKLLHRGLHSADARRQFRRERQALAQLRHPGIAHLIEAGVTDTGLAWIALELVDGMAITDYARLRRLPLPARLQLYIQVCRAVEAAHRALIVHRDLKPSNVLVTPEGQVKLLDFGIAKLLESEVDGTRTQMPAFTPAYAAPEQREDGPITTATDVFALGVLLGELLTGMRLQVGDSRTPSGRIAPDAAADVLPAPPATMRRLLRGDLDNIVLKAMAEEPAQRYASAGALAEDIERYLDNRPVLAHPPSRWYRTRRFVKRHRGGVLVTALLVVGILASLAVALWQARVAHVQAVLAEQQAARAGAVRDFLVSVFESAQADVPREFRPGIEDIVEDAGQRILEDHTLGEAERAEMLLALAHVHRNLAAHGRALALLDEAMPLVARLHGEDDPRWWRAFLLRAAVRLDKADVAGALADLEPMQSRLLALRDPVSSEGLRLLAMALVQARHDDEGAAVFAKAREHAVQVGVDVERELLRTDIAEADALVFLQRFREGLELADRAWARWQASGLPPDRHIQGLLRSINIAAEATGDLQRAETAYREAIDLAGRLHARPHPETAWAIGIYGSFLVAQMRFDEAEPLLGQALAMRRSLLGDAHPDTLNGMAAMGRLRGGQGRHDESLRWFTDGVEVCRRHHVEHNVCPRLLGSRAQIRLTLEPDRLDSIAADAEEAIAWQTRLTGADSPQVAGLVQFLARVRLRQRRFDDVLAMTDAALERFREAGAMTLVVVTTRLQRGQALFGLGRHQEALDAADQLAADYRRDIGRDSSTLLDILGLKARALAKLQRPAEARAAAIEALAVQPGMSTASIAALRAEMEQLAGRR